MTMGSLESSAAASGFEDNVGLEHAHSNPPNAVILIARSIAVRYADASYDFVTAQGNWQPSPRSRTNVPAYQRKASPQLRHCRSGILDAGREVSIRRRSSR